jgi:hypothetical protein
VQTDKRDNFLSTDFGLKEFNVESEKERIKRYRRYVYEAGALNRPEKGKTKVIGDKRYLKRSATGRLNSAEAIDSDTAPTILRIRASSDQRSLCLAITSGLSIYFTQSTKKSQNQLKAWMGYIR